MSLSWSIDTAIAELKAKERYELVKILERIRNKNFTKDGRYAGMLFKQLETEIQYYQEEYADVKAYDWRTANIKLFPILCIISVFEYWYTEIGKAKDIFNDAFNLDEELLEDHIDCFQELSLKILSGLFFIEHSEEIYLSMGSSIEYQHCARIAYNATMLLKNAKDEVLSLIDEVEPNCEGEEFE